MDKFLLLVFNHKQQQKKMNRIKITTPMRTRKQKSSIKRNKRQISKILNDIPNLKIEESKIVSIKESEQIFKKLTKISMKIDDLITMIVPIPISFDEENLMDCFPYYIQINGKDFYFSDIYEFMTVYKIEKDQIIKDRLRREFVQQKLNRTQRNLLENNVFEKEMQRIRK